MSKRVLILGGTGFVGKELGLRLVAAGHRVVLTARRPESVRGTLPFPCELHAWPSLDQPVPTAALSGCDAVVNLVGEGIADKPWTAKRRHAIRDSRVASVRALDQGLRAMTGPRPAVIVQASAIGFYGDRGEATLDETSQAGQGFLAETCQAWESHDLASLARVVTVRTGLVLGLTGGALPTLLGVYAKGLGAVLGSGKQWVSWIHIDDLTAMMCAAIDDDRWTGVVNGTAPEPCRFAAFNAALAKHGRYGANKSVPTPMIRIAMGRRSALVLDSANVIPRAPLAYGFRFAHRSIDVACEHLFQDIVGANMRRLVTRQWVPRTPLDIWPFFSQAENLSRLVPAWMAFKIRGTSTPSVTDGTRINYTLRLHGIPIGWESLIKEWRPGERFVDEQTRGPYDVWHHRHLFQPLAGGTLMTDDIQYRLPVAPLGEIAAGLFVERDVGKIFAHRRQVIAGLWPS